MGHSADETEIDSWQERGTLFPATSSKPPLGPASLPWAISSWVERLGRSADHSPSSSIGVNSNWRYTFIPHMSSSVGALPSTLLRGHAVCVYVRIDWNIAQLFARSYCNIAYLEPLYTFKYRILVVKWHLYQIVHIDLYATKPWWKYSLCERMFIFA